MSEGLKDKTRASNIDSMILQWLLLYWSLTLFCEIKSWFVFHSGAHSNSSLHSDFKSVDSRAQTVEYCVEEMFDICRCETNSMRS